MKGKRQENLLESRLYTQEKHLMENTWFCKEQDRMIHNKVNTSFEFLELTHGRTE